jgi:hypothetical protein
LRNGLIGRLNRLIGRRDLRALPLIADQTCADQDHSQQANAAHDQHQNPERAIRLFIAVTACLRTRIHIISIFERHLLCSYLEITLPLMNA